MPNSRHYPLFRFDSLQKHENIALRGEHHRAVPIQHFFIGFHGFVDLGQSVFAPTQPWSYLYHLGDFVATC